MMASSKRQGPNGEMSHIASCPVCESNRLRSFLTRNLVPVQQNALVTTVPSALEMDRGMLSLVYCEACGFIHNQRFDLTKLAYGVGYDNAQTHSAEFRRHVDGLAQYLLNERGVRDSRIVEIGCGDAYLLHKLVDDPSTGNTGVGFDPSYSGPDSDVAGRLRVERRFFDASCKEVTADVVVCRHVIEHVPDPLSMLHSLRRVLRKSPNPRVYVETPCVDWILKGNVIWDFFYEHCCYFSARSLSTAFQRAGFLVERVNHIFGEQYLWLEARTSEGPVAVLTDAGSVPKLAFQFGMDEEQMVASLKRQFASLADERRLAIWGAGAKGVTLANLLDPERLMFDCVIDINPNKQGRFIGGTGHAIVSLEQALDRGVSAAVLLNPNYRIEIESMLQGAGSPLELLDTEVVNIP